MILLPSSDCLMTGLSVKVGFTPPWGIVASSPKGWIDYISWIDKLTNQLMISSKRPESLDMIDRLTYR